MSTFVKTTTLVKISKLLATNKDKRYFVIKGGSCASKTVSILMLIINHAMKTPNQRIYVLSDELSKMKLGIILDFIAIMKDFGVYEAANFKNGSRYVFKNESFIHFLGTNDNPQLGRGLRSNLVYLNEATRCKYDTCREVFQRVDGKILIDYNPSSHFWADDNILTREDCVDLTVTYKDNEAAPQAEIDELMAYKDLGWNEDGSVKNEYFCNLYRIFALGEQGRNIGCVFTNWVTGKFIEMNLTCYGLDFGFNNDPDALVQVSIDNNEKIIYLRELLYSNKLSTDALAHTLKETLPPRHYVIADSAGGRTIEDLKYRGINIAPVKKNKVVDDIKLMQSYKIIVDSDSKNLQNELNNYIWVSNGNVPIDKYNHLLDAARYATQTLLTPRVNEDEVMFI